jgi:putative membrane protein
MFFLNRIQHIVMHHIGPFLIAIGCSGGVIRAGLPGWARRLTDSRAVAVSLRILQQPLLAAFLFVGLFFLWLVPGIHFRAMIDTRLYAVMNWSMVLDGVLFWSLVLDLRPKPPARVSFGVRAALPIGIMFPQIIVGALITFWPHDLYAYYDLCGRILPSISALNDQHIGGIVMWIPPGMMSVLAAVLVLIALRRHEESVEETDKDAMYLSSLSSRWTGR